MLRLVVPTIFLLEIKYIFTLKRLGEIFCSGAEVSDCGRYLIITISEGCDPVNKLYYCDLHQLKDGIKGRMRRTHVSAKIQF